MTPEEIRKVLFKIGMTQVQLAGGIGYSVSALNNAMSNGKFSFELSCTFPNFRCAAQQIALKMANFLLNRAAFSNFSLRFTAKKMPSFFFNRGALSKFLAARHKSFKK